MSIDEMLLLQPSCQPLRQDGSKKLRYVSSPSCFIFASLAFAAVTRLRWDGQAAGQGRIRKESSRRQIICSVLHLNLGLCILCNIPFNSPNFTCCSSHFSRNLPSIALTTCPRPFRARKGARAILDLLSFQQGYLLQNELRAGVMAHHCQPIHADPISISTNQ